MTENTDPTAEPRAETEAVEAGTAVGQLEAELKAEKDKYLRLYAEFENYKRRMRKEREDLLRYANEDLLYELLPVLDTLDMAVKHASAGNADNAGSLLQGVGNTLRELKRTIEKFGLTAIDAAGKPFDPAVHHAMSQVVRDDLDENMVVDEMRKGFMYREKVLRPTLVSVSKKTDK